MRAKFYTHYFILKRAFPLLAELCKSDTSPAQVQIPDESPDIFKDMLLYIYGLPVPAFGNDGLRTRKIIEIANKYGVTNLKIAAEVHYVSLDFIVKNAFEIAKKKQLMDIPEYLHNDILLAMALKGKAAGVFDAMSVQNFADSLTRKDCALVELGRC